MLGLFRPHFVTAALSTPLILVRLDTISWDLPHRLHNLNQNYILFATLLLL